MSERTIIQSHLLKAANELKSQSLSSALRDYANARRFPRPNEEHRNKWAMPDRTPCFVDDDSRPCALAFLMIASGAAVVANRVRDEANYAFVHEFQSTLSQSTQNLVMGWMHEHDVSLDEAAFIQPSYSNDDGDDDDDDWSTASSSPVDADECSSIWLFERLLRHNGESERVRFVRDENISVCDALRQCGELCDAAIKCVSDKQPLEMALRGVSGNEQIVATLALCSKSGLRSVQVVSKGTSIDFSAMDPRLLDSIIYGLKEEG